MSHLETGETLTPCNTLHLEKASKRQNTRSVFHLRQQLPMMLLIAAFQLARPPHTKSSTRAASYVYQLQRTVALQCKTVHS